MVDDVGGGTGPIRFEELLIRRDIQPLPLARWSRRDTTGWFVASAARKEA